MLTGSVCISSHVQHIWLPAAHQHRRRPLSRPQQTGQSWESGLLGRGGVLKETGSKTAHFSQRKSESGFFCTASSWKLLQKFKSNETNLEVSIVSKDPCRRVETCFTSFCVSVSNDTAGAERHASKRFLVLNFTPEGRINVNKMYVLKVRCTNETVEINLLIKSHQRCNQQISCN